MASSPPLYIQIVNVTRLSRRLPNNQDIEATDLQGSDFDKADCSYADLDGAHLQSAINVNKARFAPPTPDIGGLWSIGVDAKASAKIHVRMKGRAIDGKATFMRKATRVNTVVSGRLDPIDTADARKILQTQCSDFTSETNVPVQQGLGMPVARFRMEFLAEGTDDRHRLLGASGFSDVSKDNLLLAYVGAVWLVDAVDGKKTYSLCGFVPTPKHTHSI